MHIQKETDKVRPTTTTNNKRVVWKQRANVLHICMSLHWKVSTHYSCHRIISKWYHKFHLNGFLQEKFVRVQVKMVSKQLSGCILKLLLHVRKCNCVIDTSTVNSLTMANSIVLFCFKFFFSILKIYLFSNKQLNRRFGVFLRDFF